ncbi:MAG TPA: SMC-Scp complex subunit ScpB [Myxococcales bacterium]|nr:SMC-Scp complex subunit ScpB [Myxococcales bacterium]
MTTEAEDRTVEEQEAVQAAELAAEEPPAELAEPDVAEEAPVAVDPVRLVEALLFASPTPVTRDALREASGLEKDPLEGALAALAERHAEGKSGIVLTEVAGAYQFRTAGETAAAVRRLLKVRPQRLTRAALETLALIAYRQPITRADVEEVRGVDCGAVLKALLERKLVRILGKKEELGRPLLYGTSREFLEFFGLKALDQLPTLREFQELNEESRSIVEKEHGEAPPPIAGLTELADGTLQKRLDESAQDDEAAIDYLEAAMAEAEARSKVVSQAIEPKAPEAQPVEGDDPTPPQA